MPRASPLRWVEKMKAFDSPLSPSVVRTCCGYMECFSIGWFISHSKKFYLTKIPSPQRPKALHSLESDLPSICVLQELVSRPYLAHRVSLGRCGILTFLISHSSFLTPALSDPPIFSSTPPSQAQSHSSSFLPLPRSSYSTDVPSLTRPRNVSCLLFVRTIPHTSIAASGSCCSDYLFENVWTWRKKDQAW